MTALHFGALVLGGGTFGWTTDEQESFRILDAFVDAGGTAIDTADVYSAWVDGHTGGESETIIGRWLAQRSDRSALTIATKVSSLPARPGLSGSNIRAAIDESLQRLQTDYVDAYYAHRDDPNVAQEEYLGAFNELVRVGKVREIGASEFTADRLATAHTIATENGLTPFTLVQDEWNLVERTIEVDKLATIERLGLTEVPFQALATGFLTGKYRPGVTVDTGRAGFTKNYLDRPEALTLLAALDEIAAAHHVSVAAVSIAWLRVRSSVAAPISGARNVGQLPALLESMTLELAPAELDRLTAITAPSR